MLPLVGKSKWNIHVNFLIKITIEEVIVHVQVVEGKLLIAVKVKKATNCDKFDHQSKNFKTVLQSG